MSLQWICLTLPVELNSGRKTWKSHIKHWAVMAKLLQDDPATDVEKNPSQHEVAAQLLQPGQIKSDLALPYQTQASIESDLSQNKKPWQIVTLGIC
eukprot:TCALIF_02631-PA protein Name:"Protein of unknown function" AED:0.56 eAED:0.56 QI:0/0/0/0.33/1/1/3/0/95